MAGRNLTGDSNNQPVEKQCAQLRNESKQKSRSTDKGGEELYEAAGGSSEREQNCLRSNQGDGDGAVSLDKFKQKYSQIFIWKSRTISHYRFRERFQHLQAAEILQE